MNKKLLLYLIVSWLTLNAALATGTTPKIAWTQHVNSSNFEIFLMNPNGSSQTNLTNNASFDNHASICPGGKRITFVSDRGTSDPDYTNVWIMEKDGNNQTNLTNQDLIFNGQADCGYPGGVVSIVFVSTRDGAFDIYRMNADGSNVTRLTSTSGSKFHPSWCESKIVFSNGGNIYYMTGTGESITQITTGGTDNHPVCAPDNSRIAFTRSVSGLGNEVFTMNFDGTNQQNMTNHTADDREPTWSPDGTEIAFTSNRDGETEIFKMSSSLPPTSPTQLTNNTAGDALPDWNEVKTP